MGKHESKIASDGQGEFGLSKTKDVQEASGGQHSAENKSNIEDENKDESEGESDDKE